MSLSSNFEDLTQWLSDCTVQISQLGMLVMNVVNTSHILKVGLQSLHMNAYPSGCLDKGSSWVNMMISRVI